MKMFASHTGKVIFKNIWKLMLCQIISIIIFSYIIIPVFTHGFSLVMRIKGYPNVTKENYMDIVCSFPFAIFIIAVIIIALILLLLDMTMMVTLLNGVLQEEKQGIFSYIWQINRNCFRFICSRKIRCIGYMIPFGLAVYMPAFLMILYGNSMSRYLVSAISSGHQAIWWLVILGIFVVSVVIFAFKYPYVSCLILDDGSIKKAKRETEEYFKDKCKRAWRQIVWSCLAVVICILIYAAAIFVMFIILKLISPKDRTILLFYDNVDVLNVIVLIIVAVLCGISNIASVTAMSRAFQMSRYVRKQGKQTRQDIIATVLFLVVSVITLYLSVDMLMNGNSLRMSNLDGTTITAHRGYSAKAPENTLAAIQAAIDEGADYVEIDVRITADGYVVLMHDASTERTSDADLCVEDCTYETLLQLDVGSWFSEEYEGTRIPTLEEAMNLCKGQAYMNIELKPASGSGELERAVAALITEYDMEDQCVVTSFSQSSLSKVKNENEDIRTGCIYTVGYSNRVDYSSMDVLSISSKYVSRSLVAGAHEKGITVFAWTVNTRSEMQRMIACGVDSIITDNPVLLKKVLYEDSSGGIGDAYSYVLSLYKN